MQTFDTTTFPRLDPATDDGWAILEECLNGIETVRSFYRGSSDPSSGASWGADQLSAVWVDDTDPVNTVAKQWCILASPSTYGWRTLRIPKIKWLGTPIAWSFSTTNPATGDIAYTSQDLSTDLDSSGQDASQTEHLVIAVYVAVKVRTGASETVPLTDDCYLKLRTPSGTNEVRIYPQVQNRYVTQTLWLPLSAAEAFEVGVDVGGGTPAFEYSMDVLGLMELAL